MKGINSLFLKWNYVLFIFALLIIIAINVSSIFYFRKLLKTGDWVDHTYQVIIITQQISEAISYIESNQRGYLLFSDAQLKVEYQKTRLTLMNNLNQLRNIVADNPSQQSRVNQIENLIKQRLIIMDKVIDYKYRHALNSVEAIKIITTGRILSLQLRENIGKIIDEENRLLNIRDKKVESEINFYNLFLTLGQGISILFLLLTFISLKQSRKQISIIEKQLRGIIDGAKDSIVAVNHNKQFLLFNNAFKSEFFKLFNKEITLGMSLEQALENTPNNKEKVLAIWNESLTAKEAFSKIVHFENNGELSTFEINSNKIQNNDGKLIAAVHITRNISERIKEQESLKLTNNQLQAALSELADKNTKISLLLEMSDILLAANSLVELSIIITKYSQQILNFPNGCVYAMHPSKNLLEANSVWGNSESSSTQFLPDDCWALRLGRIHNVTKKTDMICAHVKDNIAYMCIPLRAQNDIFGVLYIELAKEKDHVQLSDNERLIIGAFAELSALSFANISLRESLKYQSIRDPLTSLYNRRYLEEFLYKQISQSERSSKPISILMLDLDHFKRINDVYGHDAGDLLLKEFSKLLISEIRPGDIAARYGGEEFVVVLYDTNLQIAIDRANIIRTNLSSLNIKYGGGQISEVTVSIGVAAYPTDGTNAKDLIKIADQALYSAKNSGRNKVVTSEDLINYKEKLLE